jgi:hypothetical protein
MGSGSGRIQYVATAVVLHLVFSLFVLFDVFQVVLESRALRSDALSQSRCAGSPLFAIVRLRHAASAFGFHVCRPIELRYRSGWDLNIPLCVLRGSEFSLENEVYCCFFWPKCGKIV